VWQKVGRIPFVTAGDRITFNPYASPLKCEVLFSARIISSGHIGWAAEQIPGNRSVFKSKTAPARLWVLAEGKARMIFPSNGQIPGLSRYVAPFELTGLTETLARLPHNSTVQTVTPCRFFCIQRAELLDLLRTDEILRDALILTLASNLMSE
jgi:CRP-like cAMP-binding protein